MHFAYDGFTNQQGTRCFVFRGIDGFEPMGVFSLAIEMSFFADNRVPMQDGPMICLQLLKTACAEGPTVLERFHKCRIFDEDLRPFLMARAKIAAEKGARALQHRSPYRKPQSQSNISLGGQSKGN